MRTLDAYLTKQIRMPILGAIAAMLGVATLSQSLSQFDAVIGNGQSAIVLLKITLFALPQLLSVVLPIALLIGLLVALNRLHTEQEFVACFTSGVSLSAISQPILRLATLVALVSLLSNLFLEPFFMRQMRQELFKIKSDPHCHLGKTG